MKKALIEVLFASDKRRKVLLLLRKEPKEMETLFTSLEITRRELVPQMKILKAHHLVSHYKDTYELTTIGKLIVDEMVPLLDKVEVLDTDIDYWGTRKLDFIPPHLFKRILELKDCQIVNPYTQSIYAQPPELYGAYDLSQVASKRGKIFFAVTTFFYPNFAEVFAEMIHGQVKINIIVTPDVVARIQNQDRADYVEIVKNELFNLFVYPKKIDFVSFGFNEYCLLMRLLDNKGKYDYKYMLSSNQGALEWGKELFEYYLKDSVPVTEI
ncbi:winged helix-turn-helix domain-containing protein [uncultured Methanomethylovorans sp.]|uniref:helix-turn-helix transcriptional regulator n=1 Tax=uncultured Methanomethylovorans sp. TaxID=183759 RepID=UPI002AA774EE|nr:winged helix-turn-helix domain-containing protein [uncultured Methanomethylovorans sp.]